MEPDWLSWSRRIWAIAHNGLNYSDNPFDIERYHELQTIASEMMASYSDTSPEIVRGLYEREAGHTTPKIDVRGVIFKDERVLLVKELADGLWTLPGGWIDIGDSPSGAVEREIREESGYEARAIKLLAVYDRTRHAHPPHPNHIYKLYFLCEITGGAATTSIETGGAEFFAPDDLPPLSLGRVLPEQIVRFFEHLHHPEWPTDFD